MRLLVNVSSIGERSTGMGVYAKHCARTLTDAFDCDVVAPEGSGFDQVILRAPASHSLGAGRGAAIKRWVWAKRQSRFAGRVMYSPTHHTLRKADAEILTVHDLIALRFPRQHPLQYLYFSRQLPKELARSAAVFTVSETSRQDIHEHYGYPLDRIFVVPNGVDRRVFRPAPNQAREPFLLVVGAAWPHKNVEELFVHAAAWRERYRLVVASCRGPYRRALERRARDAGLSDRVQFLEYVSATELVHLYQTCSAFVTASRWEGFGIPPLEALACGARVLASDIPAHREVLHGAGRLVRLGDRAAWQQAFADLDGPDEPGPTRPTLDRYSWKHAGRALVRALLDVEPRLTASLKSASLVTQVGTHDDPG